MAIDREDELSYLRRIELLAHAVCNRAFDEGWLSFGPDPNATPFQDAVNELGRHLRHQHWEGDGCCE